MTEITSDLLTLIASYESRFNAAVERAKASYETPVDAVVTYVKGDFAELRNSVTPSASNPTLPSRASVEERASRLCRLRVYVLPVAEVLNLGESVLTELLQWRVPAEYSNDVKSLLDRVKSKETDPKVVRAAVNQAVFIRDMWETQLNRHIKELRTTTVRLSWTIFLVAIAAIVVQWFSIGLAFLLAGICGAAISILIKPPALTVYGESVGTFSRILGRFAAGFLGTALGYALLALNLVSVNVGELKDSQSFLDNVTACTDLLHSPQEQRKTWPAVNRERADGGTDSAGGGVEVASQDGGTVSRDSPAPDGGTLQSGTVVKGSPPANTPLLNKTNSPVLERCYVSRECQCSVWRPRWVALLLALGLFFGFSERAASSFEDRVFGSSTPPPPAKPK